MWIAKAAELIERGSQVQGLRQEAQLRVVVGLSPALFQREGLRKSKPQKSCGYSLGA